jgi:acyl-coenzyme A thioesterase PaaI-like protein
MPISTGDDMTRQVTGKQPNSKMCLVCGLENDSGLKARFYELDNQELLAIFNPKDFHQSYPGRLHGGIAAAMLDETMGRAIMVGNNDEIWGVTIELNTRFKQPLPLDEELRVIARITKQNRRAFEGSGEILLPDGTIAIEGWGKFLKLPIDQIADFDTDAQHWRVIEEDTDPAEIEL